MSLGAWSRPSHATNSRVQSTFIRRADLAAAVQLYESFLDRDRSHADSLHLLGIARLQLGQADVALELISAAVALRPHAAFFRATLAEAYRATGRHDRVVDCCRAALELA